MRRMRFREARVQGHSLGEVNLGPEPCESPAPGEELEGSVLCGGWHQLAVWSSPLRGSSGEQGSGFLEGEAVSPRAAPEK